MKKIKKEWCKSFIAVAFGPRHHAFAGNPEAGIEVNLFWKRAQAAGLWEPGTYGGPMSDALAELTTIENITYKGQYLYSVFRLAERKEKKGVYTVFFDTDELPQDFETYAEAEEYGKERVAWGYASSYKIESAY